MINSNNGDNNDMINRFLIYNSGQRSGTKLPLSYDPLSQYKRT